MIETGLEDVKSAARAIVDALPDGATWDDLMYRIYVRQQIDAGLRDEAQGKVVSQEEAEQRLGIGKHAR
jgi:predicted transcriptional regulator